MRKLKSKKTKLLLKSFAEDEYKKLNDQKFDKENDEEENLQQENIQGEVNDLPVRAKASLKSLMKGVLDTKIKTQTPVFAENQKILQNLKESKEKQKDHFLKKKIQKQQVVKGHIDPAIQNNRLLERELKVTCAKGVMKVFEALRRAKEELNQQE